MPKWKRTTVSSVTQGTCTAHSISGMPMLHGPTMHPFQVPKAQSHSKEGWGGCIYSHTHTQSPLKNKNTAKITSAKRLTERSQAGLSRTSLTEETAAHQKKTLQEGVEESGR